MDVTITDKFWYEDIDVLMNKERLIEFIPLPDHTEEEWLNSTVRFSMYASTLFYVFKRYWEMIAFPFITMCLTYFFYYRNREYDEEDSDDNFSCQRPTKDNPLMNVMISDIGYNPLRKKACDVNHVKNDMKTFLNKSRYTNAFDLLADDVRERIYVTNPITTIPNNQHDFANWLYKEPHDTCKTNPRNCRVTYDLRYDRDEVRKTWTNNL